MTAAAPTVLLADVGGRGTPTGGTLTAEVRRTDGTVLTARPGSVDPSTGRLVVDLDMGSLPSGRYVAAATWARDGATIGAETPFDYVVRAAAASAPNATGTPRELAATGSSDGAVLLPAIVLAAVGAALLALRRRLGRAPA